MWYIFVSSYLLRLTAALFLEEHHYMPRSTFLVLALSCALSYAAYGQQPGSNQPPAPPAASTSNTQSSTPAPPSPATSNVPMDQAVITLKNMCQPKAGVATPPAGCVSSATRELGLENDPRFRQILQFATNQILTDALNQHIIQEASHVSDQQIEDYYKQNPKKY